jgi:endonuclease/exonuclease/phosphatase family metal-dependent hydrolase
MRVLTWNLFHGRSQPPAGRELESEFVQRLASWSWDVALLQEVPPWWPPALAEAAGAQQRTALTSRNSLLFVRRAIARRWPDAIKSDGGGSNAVLVRGAIASATTLPLRREPERRVAQLLRLGDGACVVNFHASTHMPFASEELDRLATAACAWAGEASLVLGGDLNLFSPEAAAHGLAHVAGHSVDHVFVRGFERVGEPELPDSRAGSLELSDHRPVIVALRGTGQYPTLK